MPTFTNPWDETQPPDTQLASLGAQDFRSLKGDIAERLAAFGSGTLANRPTPESVFGNSQNGVLYLATDQGIFYQWNGTAWVQAGTSGSNSTGGTGRSFIDNTQVGPLLGASGFQSLNTVLVPANFITMNGTSIEVFSSLHQTDSNNAAVNFQLLLGGTIICAISGGNPTSFDEALQVFLTVLDASTPSSSRLLVSANGYPSVLTSTGLTAAFLTGINLTVPLTFTTRFAAPPGSSGHFVGEGLVVRVTF